MFSCLKIRLAEFDVFEMVKSLACTQGNTWFEMVKSDASKGETYHIVNKRERTFQKLTYNSDLSSTKRKRTFRTRTPIRATRFIREPIGCAKSVAIVVVYTTS